MKRILAFIVAFLFAVTLLPVCAVTETVPAITNIYVHNGVVRFTTSIPVTGYCFKRVEKTPSLTSYDWVSCEGTEFSVFKMDASYYLYVRAGDIISLPVKVEVTSPFIYVIDAEGLTPIEKISAEEVMDIRDSNLRLYQYITEAGLYTREGVLTAALGVLTIFGEKGYAVRYQGCGAYQLEDNWGINPEWGKKLAHPTQDGNGKYYYTGMQCVGSIVWAYKQAGLNISNSRTGYKLGLIAAKKRSGDNKIDYRLARGGDVIANEAHYLMIVDRIDTDLDGEDDAYLTFEMKAPSLVLLIHPFRSIRYREIYNMDGIFSDESRLKDGLRFYGETTHIAESFFPEVLTKATEGVSERRAGHRLLYGFGF